MACGITCAFKRNCRGREFQFDNYIVPRSFVTIKKLEKSILDYKTKI